MDPLGNKIGGIETFNRNFIKYSPEDFEIEFVGITSNKEREVGKWQEVELYGKKFYFLPVLYVKDENTKTTIPLSAKFTFSLFKHKAKIPLNDRMMLFHRIEPSLPFKKHLNPKFLIIHSHMKELYHPFSEIRWSRFPYLYFKLEERLITQMKKIFVVRRDGVKFYQKRYPALSSRFTFLPTWVDENIFYPLPENERQQRREEFARQEGLTPQNKLILFVGRIERQKNPLLLIDSFHYVHFCDSRAILVVVGTGSLLKEVQDKVKQKGLEQVVKFFGSLPQKKVAHLMRISDVFLLTSTFEGMPISVLEALACGLPVITTDVGEVKLVVKDGFSGRVVEGGTAEIGTAVLEVLNHRTRFSPEHCLASVEPYRARNVLMPFYSYFIESIW